MSSLSLETRTHQLWVGISSAWPHRDDLPLSQAVSIVFFLPPTRPGVKECFLLLLQVDPMSVESTSTSADLGDRTG